MGLSQPRGASVSLKTVSLLTHRILISKLVSIKYIFPFEEATLTCNLS